MHEQDIKVVYCGALGEDGQLNAATPVLAVLDPGAVLAVELAQEALGVRLRIPGHRLSDNLPAAGHAAGFAAGFATLSCAIMSVADRDFVLRLETTICILAAESLNAESLDAGYINCDHTVKVIPKANAA